jgi:hypothetical protein
MKKLIIGCLATLGLFILVARCAPTMVLTAGFVPLVLVSVVFGTWVALQVGK